MYSRFTYLEWDQILHLSLSLTPLCLLPCTKVVNCGVEWWWDYVTVVLGGLSKVEHDGIEWLGRRGSFVCLGLFGGEGSTKRGTRSNCLKSVMVNFIEPTPLWMRLNHCGYSPIPKRQLLPASYLKCKNLHSELHSKKANLECKITFQIRLYWRLKRCKKHLWRCK